MAEQSPFAEALQQPAVQESLAALLDKLDRANELLALFGVFSDSMTGAMVERSVSNLTRTTLLLDRLTGPAGESLLSKVTDAAVQERLLSLLDRLEQIQNLLSLLGVFTDSMTDSMVQRSVSNLTRMTLLLDRLTGPDGEALVSRLLEAAPALLTALAKLQDLERSGRLAKLLDLLDLLGVFADSFTDSMLQRAVRTMSGLAEMGDTVLRQNPLGMLDELKETTRESLAEANADTRNLGIFGLLAVLKDPELQKGLKVVLALTKRAPALLEKAPG